MKRLQGLGWLRVEERGQGGGGPGGNTGDLREAGGPGRGLEGLEGTWGCMCEGGMRARERAGGPGGRAGAWEWGLKEAAGLGVAGGHLVLQLLHLCTFSWIQPT